MNEGVSGPGRQWPGGDMPKLRSYFLIPMALVGGCVTVTPTSKDLASALGKSWYMAPLPDGKLTPGSVIEIDPVDSNNVDLRWLGTLADCGVPTTALALTDGDTPSMTGTYSLSGGVTASFLKSVLKVSATANATGSVKINTAKDQSLDYIKFTTWTRDPSNATPLKNSCGWLLTANNTYVIEEAYIVSDGSFSSTAGGGLSVTISAPTPPSTVSGTVDSLIAKTNARGAGSTGPAGSSTASAGSSGGGSSTSSGAGAACPPPDGAGTASVTAGGQACSSSTSTVSKPITFAIKRMHQTKDGWQTLGAVAVQTDPLAGKTVRQITIAQ